MITATKEHIRAGLTIQETAKQSGLSEHTLRYYERIGLIRAIERDGSSGHRRYSRDAIVAVEQLACLRGTGMSIEAMREYLRLREIGAAAATEQKALFAAHKASLDREIELMQERRRYIAGKVAYWEAVEAGDMETAHALGEDNHRLAKSLVNKREEL